MSHKIFFSLSSEIQNKNAKNEHTGIKKERKFEEKVREKG